MSAFDPDWQQDATMVVQFMLATYFDDEPKLGLANRERVAELRAKWRDRLYRQVP